MSKRSLITVALCAVLFASVSAGSAFAGEVTGKGKPTAAPANANSICAFSGQNDRVEGEGPTTTRVQTPAEGPHGAPGHGIPDSPFANGCKGGSNFAREK
jgi:hypothetical protein